MRPNNILATFTVAAVAAFAAPTAAPLRAQSVESTIDRAVAAWAKVKTVHGTFEQTVTNPLLNTSGVTRGDYAQERPGRLSIRWSPPNSDAIVSDGNVVWIYLPTSAPGKVIKRSATGGAVPIDLTGQFLESPRTKYNITAGGTKTVDGHATHALELAPKPGTSSSFTAATVWIDDDDSLIREFEETEPPGGIIRHIRLTTVTINTPVDRALFSFVVPRGVSVVDQTK